MAAPNKPGKTMSSRLMTMKFMQRAAAPPFPSPAAPPDQPSSKRQRLSDGAFKHSSTATPDSDAPAVEQALASEERNRQDAMEREAIDRSGETKWYMSVATPDESVVDSPFRIVSTGYSMLDLNSPVEHQLASKESVTPQSLDTPGRRIFGRYKRKPEKSQPVNAAAPESGASGSSDDDDDDDDAGRADGVDRESHDPLHISPRNAAGEKLRTERRAKAKSDKAELARMAEERRNKRVNLNELTSISSAGSNSGNAAMTCYKCGEKGHPKARCPKMQKRQR